MICDRCDNPDAYAHLDEVEGILLLCDACADKAAGGVGPPAAHNESRAPGI